MALYKSVYYYYYNVAPPFLCRKAATDNLLQTIETHPNWPVYADVFEQPPPRLASRRPLWSDVTSVDTTTQWREDWLLLPTDSRVSISLVIHALSWTVSGQVIAHVLTCTNGVSPNHLLVIVASDRPWTTLSTRAHEADDDAVIWLESTATAAVAK